ncbi:alcohol dehydrogenase catalytic domain-containing protein [Shimwellia pseudoproteus]|uniref:alcohol dehydrogenase catalytic domain-containing protein n=1 Tax=Shimwellia pseudoproteus TaxID=570012 RepID=UPI0018ED2CB6|nr:alcohol dehydrogenase catalytic domain-containing protein [Shimwellia pseudoproteus]MBJ3815816.1 alcohol dehydrogenase catalytic domain-containing protein [Shimwellia pseudoproteus]
MLPATYRAWVWTGGALPSGLELHTRPMITAAPGDVIVRLSTIGLNPVDWKLLDIKQQHIPGVDGSGIVVACGPGVDNHWLGKRVAWHQSLLRDGSFAQYTTLPARVLMTVPDQLDDTQAAAFPCPGLTAWQSLDKVPARAGETVLISGAGGSVGHYLLQMAVRRGFTVHTLSHRRHFARLSALGAAVTLEEPAVAGGDVPWGERYYAIWDAVHESRAAWLGEHLRANGHLVTIQGRATLWPWAPFAKAISLHEVALGALHSAGDNHDWQRLTQDGDALLQQLASGQLATEPLVTSAFEALDTALFRLKNRDFSGKMVIPLG